jgi:hypothetical protein
MDTLYMNILMEFIFLRTTARKRLEGMEVNPQAFLTLRNPCPAGQ